MQRTIVLLAAGMLATQAYGRNGLYLSPSLGAGISNVKQHYFSAGQNGGYNPDSKSIFSYNAGLGIGYQYNNWRLETGLQYLLTGYRYEGLVLGSNFPTSESGTSEARYQHLAVPLRLGYSIKLGERFNFVPYAGITASYNMGARSIDKLPGMPVADYRWKSEHFKDQYKSISVWGNLALQLEYKASDRIRIFGGPSAQYMVSNFLKTPDNVAFKASDRPYSLYMDLGVKIGLAGS